MKYEMKQAEAKAEALRKRAEKLPEGKGRTYINLINTLMELTQNVMASKYFKTDEKTLLKTLCSIEKRIKAEEA